MDAVNAAVAAHNAAHEGRAVEVVEDCSHAQGSRHKGRLVGTFTRVAAFSCMGGKSLACGEGGFLVTDDRATFEKAVAFSHYSRHGELLTDPALRAGAGVPWGGCKGRMNQTCSAMGRVQLRHYPRRIAEIQGAMGRFWDLLESWGCPGVRAHRPPPAERAAGSTMGGWHVRRKYPMPP